MQHLVLHGADQWGRGHTAAYTGRSGISFGDGYRVGSRPVAVGRERQVYGNEYSEAERRSRLEAISHSPCASLVVPWRPNLAIRH